MHTCRLVIVLLILRSTVSTFSVTYWKSVGTPSSSTPFITAIGIFSLPLETSLQIKQSSFYECLEICSDKISVGGLVGIFQIDGYFYVGN